MRLTILPLLLLGTAAAAQTPPEGGPGRGPGMGLGMGMGMLMRADADGDGVITRAEALAEAGARFDRMDANHDGRIDKDEIARLRSMRRPGARDGRPGDGPPPPPQD